MLERDWLGHCSTFCRTRGREDRGSQIELRPKISQGDLAAMAGIARENVSRTMSEWRKRDLVTRSYDDYYSIKDARALAREL
ncbi:helix-turn-helix domain-containing protein [Bradyrhizobium sp. OAE829]|uniref:helix-turn-helix domain-containing protein n=1 Tax=Bradyrhizobium sp. OAE829 TaxID=2663807 RepID=UPI001789750D